MELASHSHVRVTLMDPHNYQQFQPLLYQVAASLLSSSNAAFALRDVLGSYPNVNVQMDEAVSVDLVHRTVAGRSGRTYAGEYLVLTAGAKANFFGVPGAAQFAHPLYALPDAEMLRSRILGLFEAADASEDAGDGSLTFVVVGGGPTGVEMAGTLCDMLQDVLKKEFRHVDTARARVVLIERSHALLGMFSAASQAYAAAVLAQRGVDLRLATAVAEVGADHVSLADGTRLPTRLVIWAAGIRATGLAMEPERPRKPNGRIEVGPELNLNGFPHVFVAGDLANALDEKGQALPQLAAVAQQAGLHCAKNILALAAGREPTPFRYSDRGILAMVGRNAAVAELGQAHHEVKGPLAFAIWLGVHATLLTTTRARLDAVLEWAWEYFAGNRPSQLIDR